MDKTEQLIEKTELLLSQIEGLQQSIKHLYNDLRAHRTELGHHLGRVRHAKKPPSNLRAVTTQERRAAPRRKGNPISVYISNGTVGAEPFEGWVVDRSAGGLRLLVDEAVEAGSILNVRPVKIHPEFPWVQVRVKSCAQERNSWNLGCQFLYKLTWEELQHF